MLNRKALAGTRGIEPPFSPRAALTSKERLTSRHTRSRRVFPCNARLSGLSDRENRLLVGCHNRNRRRAACGASFRTSYNPSGCSAMQRPRSIGGAGELNPQLTADFRRAGYCPNIGQRFRLIAATCASLLLNYSRSYPHVEPVFPGCQSVYLDIALRISTSGFLASLRYFFPSRMAWAISEAAIISPLGAIMVAMSMLDTPCTAIEE